ncbi:unnamed protein product [Protopolystoma xenopodis]|uniref:Uncharacterized protein n=1 Tax=Protopolystoma xenopodis TaxID=117903 RepID=A0A3S5CLG9_9PLAT|nr:unnamed protein product [Protopolystoma xenopodis]
MVAVQKSTRKEELERANEMRLARRRRKHKMQEQSTGDADSDDEYSDDTTHYSSYGVVVVGGGGGGGDDAGKTERKERRNPAKWVDWRKENKNMLRMVLVPPDFFSHKIYQNT